MAICVIRLLCAGVIIAGLFVLWRKTNRTDLWKVLKRMTIFILCGVAVVYLGLCVWVYANQGKLIYFPESALTQVPSDIRLTYDEVRVTAADGVSLLGWHIRIPPERRKGVVLYFHGNAGNISDRLSIAEMYAAMGYDLVLAGYRGYGSSKGAPTEKGLYLDAQTYWNYLTVLEGVAASRITIHGSSLGGGPASWLAARVDCHALIMESTFSSMVDQGRSVYPYLPISLICNQKFESYKRIGKVTAPVLVLHSPDDEYIPESLSRKLFNFATEPKTYKKTFGSHNEPRTSNADYREDLAKFLAQSLPPPVRDLQSPE